MIGVQISFTANVELRDGRFIECRDFHWPPAKGDTLTVHEALSLNSRSITYVVLFIDHRSDSDTPVVVVEEERDADS